MSTPALVTLQLWGVPGRAVPRALVRMATDRRRLRGVPGLRFAKLLGTGSGETFGLADADARHWALLTTWEDEAAADAFEQGPVSRGWESLAEERWTARLVPISSRGSWSRQAPFGPAAAERRPDEDGGRVAALTRARLVPRRAATFWRSVPPVSAALHASPGLRFAVGVGEAPVGLQGTFSVWDSAASLRAFAYRGVAHQRVIADTTRLGWYAEELFARFGVLSAAGTYRGLDPLGP